MFHKCKDIELNKTSGDSVDCGQNTVTQALVGQNNDSPSILRFLARVGLCRQLGTLLISLTAQKVPTLITCADFDYEITR